MGNETEDPVVAEDRRQTERAAGWLRATVALGFTQTLTCGCSQWYVNVLICRFGIFDLMAFSHAVLLWLRLAALLLVLQGAYNLRNRRSIVQIRVAAAVAVTVSVLILIEGIGFVWLAAVSDEPVLADTVRFGLIGLLFDVAVGYCGMVGGWMALSALNRPGVQKAFRR